MYRKHSLLSSSLPASTSSGRPAAATTGVDDMIRLRPAPNRLQKSLDAARQRRLFWFLSRLHAAQRDAERAITVHTNAPESVS